MKNNRVVYLALFVLIVLLFLSKKEGLDTYAGDKWLGFSTWFTSSPSRSSQGKTTTVITSNTGTGVNGTQYDTATDTSNDLTSNEKSMARSALTKLIALNEGDEVLINCINKVKVKL
jgi:hypothetical protein